MSEKLNQLAEKRDHARKKRDEWDAKYKTLERRYLEQEKTEVHELVHMAGLTPERLAELLQRVKTELPDGTLPVSERTEETEETLDEEEA